MISITIGNIEANSRPTEIAVLADDSADATDSAQRAFNPGAAEDQLREAVRLAVRRCATAWTGKKPLVEVMLVRAN